MKPAQPITHFARKVHGVSNERVAEAPVFAHFDAGDASWRLPSDRTFEQSPVFDGAWG